MNFKVGDVVRLNSSIDVFMTVEEIEVKDSGYVVKCVWFDTNDNLHREEFRAEAISQLE